MALEKKTAVVIAHGMGEQTPLETLRSFVDSVWTDDPSAVAPSESEYWFKPDQVSGSLDLGRVTTRKGKNGKRVDFFEFYWADLTDGTTAAHFYDWFRTLLLRSYARVPDAVKGIWVLLWAAVILIALILATPALRTAAPNLAIWDWLCFGRWPGWVFTAISAALGLLLHQFVVPYFGDVARYVRSKPPNFATRKAIRERGVELFRALHDSGRYDRIVIVAHSAGSLVAYDVLRFFWSSEKQRVSVVPGSPSHQLLQEVEALAVKLDDDRQNNRPVNEALVANYRSAQTKLWDNLRSADRPAADRWLISDFVTVGSPLTHANFLFTFDDETFLERLKTRELSSIPPVLEGKGFSYQPGSMRIMHHGAVFGVVRWTNIHDPKRFVLLGDLISGPMRPLFGPAVVDFPVTIKRDKGLFGGRFFTHTQYWTYAQGSRPEHIQRLREAVEIYKA